MLIAWGLVAQPQWSVPIQITSGNTNDIHPAFMTRYAFSNPQEEWLAFSHNGVNVCVIRTAASGEQWDSIVVSITTDAGDHDYPSLAGTYNPPKAMLLWQGHAGSNLKILYSVRQYDQWSAPQSVNPDQVDERVSLRRSLRYRVRCCVGTRRTNRLCRIQEWFVVINDIYYPGRRQSE